MNRIVGFGLAAAAMVAAVLIGAQLLKSPGGGVGTQPTDSPEPSVTPSTVEPSPSAEGYLLWSGGGRRLTVTTPAGWGAGVSGVLTKDDNGDPPDGVFIIGPFVADIFVYGDPCRSSTTKPETPATTVDEVVAALMAQASRDASAPVDVMVGGHAGKSITLHVPVDIAFSADEFTACDQGRFASWGVPGDDGARYEQSPGQIDEVFIWDMDGMLAVLDASYYPGTSAADVEELRAIVESARFE